MTKPNQQVICRQNLRQQSLLSPFRRVRTRLWQRLPGTVKHPEITFGRNGQISKTRRTAYPLDDRKSADAAEYSRPTSLFLTRGDLRIGKNGQFAGARLRPVVHRQRQILQRMTAVGRASPVCIPPILPANGDTGFADAMLQVGGFCLRAHANDDTSGDAGADKSGVSGTLS